MVITHRVLVASGPFGADLSAVGVTKAIARGLSAGGQPEPDLCPLPPEHGDTGAARELLEAIDFDRRMRDARAVIVGAERLHAQTLAASMTFEIATRARQSGVPAYAVTAANGLDAFDTRILDLQVILEAASGPALAAAGKTLAGLV